MELNDARLFKLTSLLFDAALGKDYYDIFSTEAARIGIDALAQSWGQSSLVGPLLGNNTAQQARALTERAGLNPDATDPASADAIALQFFKTNLDSGMNPGTLALAAVRFLEQDNLAAGFNNASSHLANRAEVAFQYSRQMELGGTDINYLQSVISKVNETPESIQSALLSVAQDQFTAIRNSSRLDTYSGEDDSVTGTAGSDYINAGAGYDTVDGGSGNDIILGDSGDDEITGGRGQDYIEGSDGSDTIKAGSFYEREYIKGYRDTANGGYQWVDGYYIYRFDAHYEILDGGSGHDNIYGGFGSDYLIGGDGSDRIKGEEETIYFYSDSRIPEEIQVRMHNDTIDGGAGADNIDAGYGNDSVLGGTGNDTISAGNGNDTVHGGDGADSINAGDGVDYIEGGSGNDIIEANGYNNSDETAADTVYGNDGDDRITASNGDNVDAGDGADRINFIRSENGGHGVVIAGEGEDVIDIDSYGSYDSGFRVTTALTIDLTEKQQVRDLIYFDIANRDQHGVEIKGFDLDTDQIDLQKYIDIYDPEAQYYYSTTNSQEFHYRGGLFKDYVQIVSDISTPWHEYSYVYGADNTSDSYGKAFFVIQGASIASSSTSDAAALIDAYGNNAKYGDSEEHIFLVNIQNVGIGIYAFEDDTGANNTVISDEIQLVGTLNDVYTESITTNNADFII